MQEQTAAPVVSKHSHPVIRWIIRIAIIIGLFITLYTSIIVGIFDPIYYSIRSAEWTKIIVRPSLLWIMMGFLLLAFRTALWFVYKPFPSAGYEEAPVLTVIIPAYNEGAMVRKSIDSVARAKYPHDKLEILAVDDGSTDDTWQYIQQAAAEHGALVTAVRFAKNQGKRAALAEGFRRARGEFVVTIDSDSVIEEDTLLAVIGPFSDPRVGAVAGKVAVYNRQKGLIPRMLHVRFILSFDFLRATQSAYGTVYCCPGALSAYRMSVVREVMDKWLKQTFLGTKCTYGEDRALTNLILARQLNAVYQRTAVVHTIVPWTYKQLCKMYLRWDRSYIREEINFARIVWKRPLGSRIIAIWDKTITNLRFPIGYASLILLVYFTYQDPTTILRLLYAMGCISFFNMLYYLHSEHSWDFVFGIVYAYFSFFALFWLFPYAAMTLRSRSWMTR